MLCAGLRSCSWGKRENKMEGGEELVCFVSSPFLGGARVA